MDDVLAVLEFINLELVERGLRDHQLYEALDKAYRAVTQENRNRFRWPGSSDTNLRRIAGLHMDSAIQFERVTSTLKLLGDQYYQEYSIPAGSPTLSFTKLGYDHSPQVGHAG
jgi:hypothetical protein